MKVKFQQQNKTVESNLYFGNFNSDCEFEGINPEDNSSIMMLSLVTNCLMKWECEPRYIWI